MRLTPVLARYPGAAKTDATYPLFAEGDQAMRRPIARRGAPCAELADITENSIRICPTT